MSIPTSHESPMQTANTERFERFDDESVPVLVHTFYDRIQRHPTLAPIFNSRIEDWPEHLGRMVAFWTSILRQIPAYTMNQRGSPPELHRASSELQLAHFDDWLELWHRTTHELFIPARADELNQRALMIAHGLSRHLAPY